MSVSIERVHRAIIAAIKTIEQLSARLAKAERLAAAVEGFMEQENIASAMILETLADFRKEG